MKTVFIGADHRGFKLKTYLKKVLLEAGFEVEDKGNEVLDTADDYVGYAYAVAMAVATTQDSLGVVICGSGVGVSVVANKIPGIRCALISNKEQAEHARASDNCNVIALASDYTDEFHSREYVLQFIHTVFEAEERMVRRLSQIAQLETHHKE